LANVDLAGARVQLLPALLQPLQDRALGSRHRRLFFLGVNHDAIGLGLGRLRLRLCFRRLVLGRALHRAGDVAVILRRLRNLLRAAREIQVLLRPGRLGLLRIIVEHIAAIEHEACHLEYGKAKDGDDNHRNDADVAKRFHAARPPDLRRSENASAAAATALALETLAGGRRAGSGSGSTALCGRAAIAILESLRTTWSHSPSWRFKCSDMLVAAASWLPRFSLTSRTACLSPPIARSAISVAVINSPITAFNECSSALRRLRRLLRSMQ